MDLGLKGRVAIVAAASSGLGFAVAQELSREGAAVAICARTADALQTAAEKIRSAHGGEVFEQALDVTDPAAVANFVAAVETRFGRVDICITNSGGPPSKLFADTRNEDWKAAVDLLLMSCVSFARETLPRMKKNKWGRFITITSYTLANEYGPHGITVNNVCPGYTRTARLSELVEAISGRTGAKSEEVYAGWEKQIPAGRLGTPEEFAAVVTFLASERASYVNGTSIAIDGGIVRSLL